MPPSSSSRPKVKPVSDPVSPGGSKPGSRVASAHPPEPVIVLPEGSIPLTTQVHDLEQLHEATLRVARCTNLREGLQEILQVTLDAVGAGQGLISLADSDSEIARVMAAVGFPETFLSQAQPLATAGGPCGLAFTQKERVVVEDAAVDPVFAGCRELPEIGGFRSTHSVPLLTQDDEALGVITVTYTRPHRPDSREVKLTDLYARMAADLVNRLRLLDELRVSEDRLRTLAHHAPVGIFIVDTHGALLFANRHWCAMSGFSNPEQTQHWLDAVHPEDRGAIAAAWEEAVRRGTGTQSTFRFQRKDGTTVWVQGQAVPLPDGAGGRSGYLGITADVTELKRAEAAVRKDDERHRQLLQTLPIAVYTTDAEGRVQLYNDAAVALWGGAPPGRATLTTHQTARDPLPPAHRALETALQNGRPARGVEAIVIRPNGDRRIVLANPHPLFAPDGTLIGGINALVDVTERQRAEEARATLAAIVQSSDDAIVSKDISGVVRSWNAAAERLFGYSADEAIGQPITLLFPADRLDEEDRIMARIRAGDRIEHFETKRQRKDGTLCDVSVTISPLRDAAGRIIGASKIARDIGERKRAEREMEIARDNALAASRAKDDFLATLSHELRTPLNPVLLVASNASADPSLPANVRADFAMIRDNVELEARLIDDLLDITRITRGKLTLKVARQDLHRILRHALETIRPEIDHKQLTLKRDLDPRQPAVQGDAVRLQQVLWNVVNNAVKFTPTGGEITIRTRCDLPRRRVRLEISDNGIGMTEEELARIFHAFTQGNHAQGRGSHQFGGLGLGLTISRMLTELHHGSIRATSAGLGQGCTFVIELPMDGVFPSATLTLDPFGVAGSGGVDAQPTDERQRRILLVEDHEATRSALARLLTRRQFTVVTAASAAEARRCAAEGGIDLVISDIGLPDENGYELMKHLREAHKLHGIALTGYGTDQDIAHSQSAGFSAHLTKPVTVQALDQALAVLTMNEA